MVQLLSQVGKSMRSTYFKRPDSYKLSQTKSNLDRKNSQTGVLFLRARHWKLRVTIAMNTNSSSPRILSQCHTTVAMVMYAFKFLPFRFPGFTCMTSTSEPTSATKPWRAARQSMVEEPCKARIETVNGKACLGCEIYISCCAQQGQWLKL